MASFTVTGPGGRSYTLNGPDNASPEDIQKAGSQFRDALIHDPYAVAEHMYDLPTGLLRATAHVESSERPDAVSPTGARGLMQFTHRTGKQYGINDQNWKDPHTQIDAAGQYYRDLLRGTKGDLRQAIYKYGDPNDKKYVEKVLGARQRLSGTQPGPSGQPTSTPPPPSPVATQPQPPTPPKKPLGLVGTAVFRGFTRPVAQVASLAYESHISGVPSPPELQRAMVYLGLPGAERLHVEVPKSITDIAEAALAPAEVTMPVLYGLGVVAQRLTDNEHVGDAVEAVLGGYQLLREAPAAARLVSSGVREFRALPRSERFTAAGLRRVAAGISSFRVPSPNESRALEAETHLKEAEAAVPAAQPAIAGAQISQAGTVAQAQKELQESREVAGRAEEMAGIRREAARQHHAEAVRRVDAAEKAVPTTSQVLRERFGIPDDLTPSTVATGLRTPTEEGRGIPGMSKRLAQKRRDAYEAENSIADRLGITLPRGHALDQSIKEAGFEYQQTITKSPGATPAEKKLADEMMHFGQIPLRDPRTGEVMYWVERPAAKGIAGLEKVPENVTYRELRDFHSRMSQIAIKPHEYPFLQSKDGRRAFYRLKAQLNMSLMTLAASHPELVEAAGNARHIVRDIEKPFLLQTAQPFMRPTKTPQKAFESIIKDDPTHLIHLFQHATGEEREAMGYASLHQLITDNTVGDVVKWEKVVEDFDKLPKESRQLLAATGNGRAARVLDELRGLRTEISSAKDAEKAATARMLKAENAFDAERQVSLTQFKRMTTRQKRVLAEAEKDVKDAFKAAADRVVRAKQARGAYEKALRRPVGDADTVLRPQGSFGKSFGYLHIFRTFADLASGWYPFAIMQGTMAYMFLRRPKLVKEALNTSVHTPEGRQIAAALHATLQGWRGYALNHRKGFQTAAPPMRETQ